MIIGITGKIGSGKSTLAGSLLKKGYTEYTFATPLKKIGEIFGFSELQLYGTQEQKLEIHPYWKVSAREFLQKVGTDLFRVALPEKCPKMYSVWTRLFIMRYLENRKDYVISDVRFPDEAKVIKDLGGVVIRAVRDCPITSEGGAEHQHSSETEMDKIEADYVIDNNLLTKEQAEEELDRLLKHLSVSRK